MVKLEVGTRVGAYIGKADGCYLSFDASGGLLTVLMRSPSAREIAAMQSSSTFEIRYTVVDDVMFFTVKFGVMPWMDAPYSPQIGARPALSEIIPADKGLAMMIALADTTDGTIKTIRLVGLGTKFSRALTSTVIKLGNRPMDRAVYDHVVATTMQKYTTKDLAAMSENYYKSGGDPQ